MIESRSSNQIQRLFTERKSRETCLVLDWLTRKSYTTKPWEWCVAFTLILTSSDVKLDSLTSQSVPSKRRLAHLKVSLLLMLKCLFIKQVMLIKQTIKSLLAKLGLKCKTKNSRLTSKHYKVNLTQESLTRKVMMKKLTMKTMG